MKAGRSLTNYYHRENRIGLGKNQLNLLSLNIDFDHEKKKKCKQFPHNTFSLRLNFTPSFPDPLPPHPTWSREMGNRGLGSVHDVSAPLLLPPHPVSLLHPGLSRDCSVQALRAPPPSILLVSSWGLQGCFSHFFPPTLIAPTALASTCTHHRFTSKM